MPRFTVSSATREGETLYELRDTTTGCNALVWPAFGDELIDAWLPDPAGRPVHAILGPETLDQVRQQPSWWGNPLLYPWAGVVQDSRFTFEGKEYRLKGIDANDSTGHGFVKSRPWEVIETKAGEENASIACAIESSRFPEVQARFPFPSRLTVTYRLDGGGLTLEAQVENTGNGNLPFAFGAHPYFRIPIAETGERARCTVHVPAHRRWYSQRAAAVAPDTPLAPDVVSEPVPPDLDLRQGLPLEDRHFNGVCWELDRLDGGVVEAYVSDPAAGLDLVMRASPEFHFVVVWSPPGRPGICLEPWTAPPDAFNLAARGLHEAHLIVLPPGGRWNAWMRLYVRQSES
jgi:aldose 1-epimerase